MQIYQPSEGYRYNSDSIFLYQFVSSFNPRGALLDVGCGVGVISLLLSRDFTIETTIIDKQQKMIDYARQNFAIHSTNVDIIRNDFVTHDFDRAFDFIVSNPPFYHSDVTQSNDEHINTARYAHHLPLKAFIFKVKALLKPKGWFIFCYDAKQIDEVLFYLKEAKINPVEIQFVHSKIDRESKLVMIAARYNSASMTKVRPPLIVFDEQSNYLPTAQKAFDMAATHTLRGDFG
ncbi:MAG: methyltransferase [Campylobacterales bacterium]|nr:methyltransferase [Campylobacterales bacterium]